MLTSSLTKLPPRPESVSSALGPTVTEGVPALHELNAVKEVARCSIEIVTFFPPGSEYCGSGRRERPVDRGRNCKSGRVHPEGSCEVRRSSDSRCSRGDGADDVSEEAVATPISTIKSDPTSTNGISFLTIPNLPAISRSREAPGASNDTWDQLVVEQLATSQTEGLGSSNVGRDAHEAASSLDDAEAEANRHFPFTSWEMKKSLD
jgi:hypothetical protein